MDTDWSEALADRDRMVLSNALQDTARSLDRRAQPGGPPNNVAGLGR